MNPSRYPTTQFVLAGLLATAPLSIGLGCGPAEEEQPPVGHHVAATVSTHRLHFANLLDAPVTVVASPTSQGSIADMYTTAFINSLELASGFSGANVSSVVALIRTVQVAVRAGTGGFGAITNALDLLTGSASLANARIQPGEFRNILDRSFGLGDYLRPSSIDALLGGTDTRVTVLANSPTLGPLAAEFDTNSDYSWIATPEGVVRSRHGTIYQQDPYAGFVRWVPIFRDRPHRSIAGFRNNGRPEVYACDAQQRLLSIGKQHAAWDAPWTPTVEDSLDCVSVAAAQLADGRPQLFVIRPDGSLWSRWKSENRWDAPWTEWSQDTSAPRLSRLLATQLSDGRPQLFGMGVDGRLWAQLKTDSYWNAPWAAWGVHETPVPFTHLAAARLSDGRPQLFATDRQGRLWSTMKIGSRWDAPWTTWYPQGVPNEGQPGSQIQRVAVAQLSDGRPQLFVVDAEGRLWSRWKSENRWDAPWTDWGQDTSAPALHRADQTPAYLDQLTAFSLADGRPQLYLVDRAGRLWAQWKRENRWNALWTDWLLESGPLPRSCAEVRATNPGAADGEYGISAGGRLVSVYCHDMAGAPREYLQLNRTAGGANVSRYGQGPNTSAGGLTTSYTRVRLHPADLTVDQSDGTFTTSAGQVRFGATVVTRQPYADAGDCLGPGSATGTATVDLRGTPFSVVPGQFTAQGSAPGGAATYSAGNQVVALTGGGNCGGQATPAGTRLRLQFAQ